jgi:hypothetical protein
MRETGKTLIATYATEITYCVILILRIRLWLKLLRLQDWFIDPARNESHSFPPTQYFGTGSINASAHSGSGVDRGRRVTNF